MPGQSPPEDLYLGAYRTNSSLLQAGGKLGFWGCPRCCPLASPLPQSCPGSPPSACVRDTVLSCSCPDTPQGCQLCLCFHGLQPPVLTLPGPQATCPGSNSSASASHRDLPRLSLTRALHVSSLLCPLPQRLASLSSAAGSGHLGGTLFFTYQLHSGTGAATAY